ncbi:MAG: hypothetical protein LH679_16950 [Cyanobacteria bacterium CAN_BIN43]|nr:hypothetical protein [Cyanobacteria bacterium CAN_BIN43]
MRKPNFRKAVRNNKCSGRMFAQAYPRPAGHTKYFCFNYCTVCEGCTVVFLSTKLCEYCTNNAGNKPPLPSFELGAHVKYKASIGLAMQGNIAEVIGSEYVSNKRWSGWIYKLTNKTITESIYVREIWLEVARRGS